MGPALVALLIASAILAAPILAAPSDARRDVTVSLSPVGAVKAVRAVKATAEADTYVNAAFPSRAYGADSSLRMDGAPRRAYVRFALRGLIGTVVKAKLGLYALRNGPGIDARFVADSSWNEASLTFANAPVSAVDVTAASGRFASKKWIWLDVARVVQRDGVYTFALTSTNGSDIALAARERGTSTTAQLVVEEVTDSTPPSQPTNLRATNISGTGATVSWSPSTDDSGNVSYDVYRDGAKLGSTTATSFQLTGLKCGAAYNVMVAARDSAGKVSPSSTLTIATSACLGPPAPDDLAPSAPTGLAITGATGTTIAVAWTAATDNVAVSGYRVSKDGAQVGETTGTTRTLTGLSCGRSYVVGVQAYDAAGNRSSEPTVVAATSSCPDTVPPAVPSMVAATGISETTISLAWGASFDNTGVSGYGLYRGGALLDKTALTTYTFTGLQCGSSYTLGVDAYDAVGNRSSVATVIAATNPCPDRQAPAVSLTQPAAGDVVPASTAPACTQGRIPSATCVLLNVAASDNFGVTAVRYYVDGALVAEDLTCCDWSEDWDSATVPNGQHQLVAKAWDAANNMSTSAAVTFSVKNTTLLPPPPPPPPSSTSPSPPAGVGVTYYVSSNAGSDTNNGLSASSPWRTLARVNAAPLNPGDMVLFKAGESWSGVVNITRSGNSVARITLDLYGTGVPPRITGGSGDRCIELRGHYLAVRNLQADNCRFGLGIFGNDALVERSIFTNNAEGLRIEPGSLRATVAYSEFRDNNKMVVNTIGGDDDYGAMGVLVGGDDAEVHHNTFSGHTAASYDYGRDGAAIEVFGGQRGRFHHNVSVDNVAFTELGNSRSADNTYSYNVVRATIGGASFLETRGVGNTFGPVYRTSASHNSVYLSGPSSPGIWCGNCGRDILKLRNNAIKVTDGFALTGADEDYNILSGAYLSGTLGAHSRRVDPLFISPSDLHLQPTSPAIDTGVDLGTLVDFDGVAVPAGVAPDMGAYEHR